MSVAYTREPDGWLDTGHGRVAVFHDGEGTNVHADTVASFGEEWTRFPSFDDEEIRRIGDEYFDVVEPHMTGDGCAALDLGCGSGRWSRYLARRCAFVEAVDPSEAVHAAAALTADLANVRVTRASADGLPFPDDSFDFVLCLGILHHIPDTGSALARAVSKLRPGGWILVYVYYDLETRGALYRALFGLSTLLRRGVSRLPRPLKHAVCDVIAAGVYLPLVTLARVTGSPRMPLHYYADKSWWVIRNDALDRFGTPLEQRFTRTEIRGMMEDAGLVDIRFSEAAPFWHAVGRRAP